MSDLLGCHLDRPPGALGGAQPAALADVQVDRVLVGGRLVELDHDVVRADAVAVPWMRTSNTPRNISPDRARAIRGRPHRTPYRAAAGARETALAPTSAVRHRPGRERSDRHPRERGRGPSRR